MGIITPKKVVFRTLLLATLGTYFLFLSDHPWEIRRHLPLFKTPFAYLGYTTRFLLGETPEWVLKSVVNNKVQLILRSEFILTREQYMKSTVTELQAKILPTAVQLQDAGVEVVLMFIPTKLSIENFTLSSPKYVERWSLFSKPEQTISHETTYQAIDKHFQGFSLNLFQAFRGHHRLYPEDLLYSPIDHHWTSLGMAIATREVIDHLNKKRFQFSPVKMSPGEPLRSSTSYLTNMLNLPHWFVFSSPDLMSMLPSVDISPAPPRKGRMVLLGTSFSNETFLSLLRSATGLELISFAKGKYGHAGGIRELSRSGFQLKRGDILLWEIPLCCLHLADDNLPLPSLRVKKGETVSEISPSLATRPLTSN